MRTTHIQSKLVVFFLMLLLAASAQAQRRDNWVQRTDWTNDEIIQAFRRAFTTDLSDADILALYRGSQSAPFAWRIHMGHQDPHFALRFNAELHGYNPRLARGSQTFLNRCYNAGAGVRPGNVLWELAGANTSTGALSGGGPIINNPTAMSALETTAVQFPGIRTAPGGPYMAEIDAALASGEKVAIRFTKDGFELIPRELPGRPAPPAAPKTPATPAQGRPTVRVVSRVGGFVVVQLVLSNENVQGAIQDSGEFWRERHPQWMRDCDEWVGDNLCPVTDVLANNCVVDSVMDPIECGCNWLFKNRIDWDGIHFTGKFEKGNGKGCWSFDYDRNRRRGRRVNLGPRPLAGPCEGGNPTRVDPPYEPSAHSSGGCSVGPWSRLDGGSLVLLMGLFLTAWWWRRRSHAATRHHR